MGTSQLLLQLTIPIGTMHRLIISVTRERIPCRGRSHTFRAVTLAVAAATVVVIVVVIVEGVGATDRGSRCLHAGSIRLVAVQPQPACRIQDALKPRWLVARIVVSVTIASVVEQPWCVHCHM